MFGMKEQKRKVQTEEKSWEVTLKFPEEREESERVRCENRCREIAEVLSGIFLEGCH